MEIAVTFATNLHSQLSTLNPMQKIPSFTVNHLTLRRGVYVSRQDQVGTQRVTTFDIRMKAPNREPALHINATHAIEPLAATFLRNHPTWGERIIYWGPMGCLTGQYLIVQGDLTPEDILPLVVETFEFIAAFEGEIPGANPRDCGNYQLMDLNMARWESRKFLDEVLRQITPDRMTYPE